MFEKSFTTSTGKTKIVAVMKGDIARVSSPCMITAINSGGMWMGGIDGVIMRHAGQQYHNQVELPAKHLDTIVAKQTGQSSALFNDVLFVIDDLEGPVTDVVYEALRRAADSGYEEVSLPAIRTGVMLGVVEKDAKDACSKIIAAIDKYFVYHPDSTLNKITFVIYDGGEVQKQIEASAQTL